MYRPELNISNTTALLGVVGYVTPLSTVIDTQAIQSFTTNLPIASLASITLSSSALGTTTTSTSTMASSSLLNSTSAKSSKVDCAKECPCGVPVIPVPDQWLEVMVTGGFKVWHIIFIIIAFIVTTIVVYCCFHRCRIPRTKQEIEADLMRMNITNKFRDYLQEFPNEPTTFLEALKKVQELEEKSEKDDAEYARDSGARKRMGWLKLKGKDKDAANVQPQPNESITEPPVNNIEKRQVTIDTEPPTVAAIEPEEKKSNIEPAVQQPKDAKKMNDANGETLHIKEGRDTTLDETTKVRLQQRRRKQKPNLSRSKRAREPPPVADSTEKSPPPPPPPLPLTQPPSMAVAREPSIIKDNGKIEIDMEHQPKQTQPKQKEKQSSKLVVVAADKQPAASGKSPRASSKPRRPRISQPPTSGSHEHVSALPG